MKGHEAADKPTTVPLIARQAGDFDLGLTEAALGDLSWLGRSLDDRLPQDLRRAVVTDLELPIRDGSAIGPVRKAAIIEIGPAQKAGDGIVVAIAWRSATAAPLFPVFAGRLSVTSSEVLLDGRYAPPFGALGMLIDQTLLHFVARRTASALVARLARRFESSVQ